MTRLSARFNDLAANPVVWVILALIAIVNMIVGGVEWWNVVALAVFAVLVAVTGRRQLAS